LEEYAIFSIKEQGKFGVALPLCLKPSLCKAQKREGLKIFACFFKISIINI
jgi:hypothetical protein